MALPRLDTDRCFSRPHGSAAFFVLNVLSQGDGVVVLGIVRAVQKGHCAMPCGQEDRLPRFWSPIEFGEVPATELLPFRGIVTEPLSQFGPWRGILDPAIEVQRSFLDSARPKPFNKVPDSVSGALTVVDSFQFDHLDIPSSDRLLLACRPITRLRGAVRSWSAVSSDHPWRAGPVAGGSR